MSSLNPEPILVGVVMGSASDWRTMKAAADTLVVLGIAHEAKIVSAHRTPDLCFAYAATAKERGLRAIIAGAGGAAHLPGMLAAKTTVPVLGVPIAATVLGGVDALLSMVQMPQGIAVATFAIGQPGAVNAAVFAAQILAWQFPAIAWALETYRKSQTDQVLAAPAPNLT